MVRNCKKVVRKIYGLELLHLVFLTTTVAFAKTSPSAVDGFVKRKTLSVSISKSCWRSYRKLHAYQKSQMVCWVLAACVGHYERLGWIAAHAPGNISSFQRTSWENVTRPEVYWFEFEHQLMNVQYHVQFPKSWILCRSLRFIAGLFF